MDDRLTGQWIHNVERILTLDISESRHGIATTPSLQTIWVASWVSFTCSRSPLSGMASFSQLGSRHEIVLNSHFAKCSVILDLAHSYPHPKLGQQMQRSNLGEGHCFLRMIQPPRDLPVYHPLDGNVPRRRVGHLLLARWALARLNQLAVALLADDVRILAFVYVSRSYGHANGTFQFAQELNR